MDSRSIQLPLDTLPLNATPVATANANANTMLPCTRLLSFFYHLPLPSMPLGPATSVYISNALDKMRILASVINSHSGICTMEWARWKQWDAHNGARAIESAR